MGKRLSSKKHLSFQTCKRIDCNSQFVFNVENPFHYCSFDCLSMEMLELEHIKTVQKAREIAMSRCHKNIIYDEYGILDEFIDDFDEDDKK